MSYSDFPAEIRAPKGSVRGVSGFQIHIETESKAVNIGEEYDILVALNPAAMVSCLPHLSDKGLLIVDHNQFSEKNLRKSWFGREPT